MRLPSFSHPLPFFAHILHFATLFFLLPFLAQALGNGVLFSRSKYIVEEEIKPPKPNICVTVSQAHTKEQLEKAATVLKQALVKFDAAIKTN